MRDTWLRNFSGPPSLRTLIVEYETLVWKKNQMDRIIAHNKKFKLRIQEERRAYASEDTADNRGPRGYLSAENTKLEEWKWKGPSKLNGRTWQHHGDKETVEYVVVVDRWQFVEGELAEVDTCIHQ